MTPQLSCVIEFAHRLIGQLSPTHRNITVSVAIRVLVLWAGVLCVSSAREPGQSPRQALLEDPGEINLLQEGITVIAQSHVSVHKMADVLLVQVLDGEVLFERREPTRYPVVVTAGNAQLSKIRADVCVQVQKERTVVSVLDGAVEMSELRAQEDRPELEGITLRTGDRVELRKIGRELQYCFTPASLERTHCAGSTP